MESIKNEAIQYLNEKGYKTEVINIHKNNRDLTGIRIFVNEKIQPMVYLEYLADGASRSGKTISEILDDL